jgi:hypothetical protein
VHIRVYDNNDAAAVLESSLDLHPEIHWDDAFDHCLQARYLLPLRNTNPWETFSTGVGAAYIKQLFSLTKGRRHHWFVHTATKVSMVTRTHAGDTAPALEAEYLVLMQRAWPPELLERDAHIVAKLARNMDYARAHNLSFKPRRRLCGAKLGAAGARGADDAAGGRPAGPHTGAPDVGKPHAHASESLAAEVWPLTSCDAYFLNPAPGCKDYGTDCTAGNSNGDQTDRRFFG